MEGAAALNSLLLDIDNFIFLLSLGKISHDSLQFVDFSVNRSLTLASLVRQDVSTASYGKSPLASELEALDRLLVVLLLKESKTLDLPHFYIAL